MGTATSQYIPQTPIIECMVALAEEPEQSLGPLRGTALTPGMAQTPISTQDQKAVTSNPIVTAPQSSGNPVTDNTVTQSTSSILQLASSSSNSAVTFIHVPNIPVAQYTSPISYLTSSSSIPLIAIPNLSGNSMTQPPTFMFQRTSSSSTSALAATRIPSRAVAQSTSSINEQTSSDNILPIFMPQLPNRSRARATSSANHQTSCSSSSSPAIAVSQLPNSPISQSSSSINYQIISINSISSILASQLPDTANVFSTSSSSTLATAVTQLCDNPISQSPSSINHQSSSSFNNDTPATQLPYLPFNTVTHKNSSMDYQISSSSSSNSKPSHILPSDSMLNDHPPGQIFPATTLAIVRGPLATQAIVLEGTASTAVGLANARLAGMGILPPEASATPGEVANAATESGGDRVEVVQIFPTTTLIVSTVSSVPAATTSAVEGPTVLISAGTGMMPSGKIATLGKPANSAIPSGGNGSSVVTGSGSTTGSGSATGSVSTTGSGTPTESVSGQTNVPIVPTGGAEGVTRWANWWLEFGILVWGVGMVCWM